MKMEDPCGEEKDSPVPRACPSLSGSRALFGDRDVRCIAVTAPVSRMVGEKGRTLKPATYQAAMTISVSTKKIRDVPHIPRIP